MKVIEASSPDNALAQGMRYLLERGVREPSRVGEVLVSPMPVATVYPHPRARVSYSPVRDANPFFHVMEALWMLAGRNDVAFLAAYNQRMAEFSDDGATLHGAYGFRWREFFGYDQLPIIIEELRTNPHTRRAVLAMWDGNSDLHQGLAATGGKDVPCNTHVYFRVRGVFLDMTVCCRSNDIVWGAYGANVVHFGFLQEYIADKLKLSPGVYTQVSNNYHAYIDRSDVQRLVAGLADLETLTLGNTHPLYAESPGFDERLPEFLEKPSAATAHDQTFLRDVALPLHQAYVRYREAGPEAALEFLPEDDPTDWIRAGRLWMERRVKKLPTLQEVR